jgi:hypothetical protein
MMKNLEGKHIYNVNCVYNMLAFKKIRVCKLGPTD